MHPSALMTRVFVAEPSLAFRQRLIEALLEIESVTLSGFASSVVETHARILALRPHVVVLEFLLEDGLAPALIARACPHLPSTLFIVFTLRSALPYRKACLAAGAAHVLDKSLEFDHLRTIVEGHRARLCRPDVCGS